MKIQTKIAILPSYTLNNVVAPLKKKLFDAGIDVTIKIGGFGEYNQELLSPTSWLVAEKADFILIALSSRAIMPDLFLQVSDMSFSIDLALAPVRELLKSIENSTITSNIILTTLEMPVSSSLGYKDAASEKGVRAVIQSANNEIVAFAKKHPTINVLDFEFLVSKLGSINLTDEKMWYLGKLLLTNNAANIFAQDISTIIMSRYGQVRKCLVVDLDNTLWGGVIGEDGIEKLALGNSKIGDIYSDVQKILLALKRQGTLLAICSKNNESDVFPIFNDSRMILKKEDFAAMRINWQPKSVNIESIAKELNIGVDSLAFLDDNPAERLEVSTAMADVLVIDFPQDIARLPQLLMGLDCFTTGATTKEDLERAKMYVEDKARRALETSHKSLHEYLGALQTRIVVKKNDLTSLARITQLINKTNQFNLRTIRYTESDVLSLMKSPESFVCCVSVFDKFGEMGLTGVAVCKAKSKTEWFVDSFLLSCRILSRDIELQFFQEVLSYIPVNVLKVSSEFISTPKNSQVESFWDKVGFTCTQSAGGKKLYEASIKVLKKEPVLWIKVEKDE